LQCQW